MDMATTLDLSFLCTRLTDLSETIRVETNEVVAGGDHIAIIKHYDKLRQATALIKESREALAKLEETLSREQIPAAMRGAGVRTLTIEGVGRVSLGTRWSASITNKSEGFDWLRGNGHGGVIQETVNAQTLGALAKEMGQDGLELPAPTFTTNVMTYTSVTKVK
jgi:hypothetical protein